MATRSSPHARRPSARTGGLLQVSPAAKRLLERTCASNNCHNSVRLSSLTIFQPVEEGKRQAAVINHGLPEEQQDTGGHSRTVTHGNSRVLGTFSVRQSDEDRLRNLLSVVSFLHYSGLFLRHWLFRGVIYRSSSGSVLKTDCDFPAWTYSEKLPWRLL